MRAGDTSALRKERGAFFTPPAIADFLAAWATAGADDAVVLDPTCGEAVFLLAAADRLKARGRTREQLTSQLRGFDLHGPSLQWAQNLLESAGAGATLAQGDFFDLEAPVDLSSGVSGATGAVEPVDAVIGNPPFVRYQLHSGKARDRSKAAALAQGVRLSNLASTWAALLIHSCGFLKPEGRLAMVLPAELLSVDYAEPVRAWLKNRFEQVHLVFLEKSQFTDASEKVVLLLAAGSGGCDAFSLYFIHDAPDLANIGPMSGQAATVSPSGKWNALQLSNGQRSTLAKRTSEHFISLNEYGNPLLGSVTGANEFFTITESERARLGLSIHHGQVQRLCPSQSKFNPGLTYTDENWNQARDAGERVWLFRPSPDDSSSAVADYIQTGVELKLPDRYKCRKRDPWWVPPAVTPPDLFFTYMSHRAPRLITNKARITMLNSMHGVRLKPGVPASTANALPLLFMNSLTLLASEVAGRWYGNGVLKIEPREAGKLPVPTHDALEFAWSRLKRRARTLDSSWQKAGPVDMVDQVDRVLLYEALEIPQHEIASLAAGLKTLRNRRLARGPHPG